MLPVNNKERDYKLWISSVCDRQHKGRSCDASCGLLQSLKRHRELVKIFPVMVRQPTQQECEADCLCLILVADILPGTYDMLVNIFRVIYE